MNSIIPTLVFAIGVCVYLLLELDQTLLVLEAQAQSKSSNDEINNEETFGLGAIIIAFYKL